MNDSPLEKMLDRIDSLSEDQDEVSFGDAMDAAGEHSFAPILLLVGVIMMVPGPADIPGVPVVLGLLVIVVAVQFLFGRKHIWIPNWMEDRHVDRERLQKMIRWLKKPAKALDRITKHRYPWLVSHAGAGIVAIACIMIAAATPVLEFVPFSANIAGAAIAAFSLALIAKDGLVAGIAMVFSLATVALVAGNLMR